MTVSQPDSVMGMVCSSPRHHQTQVKVTQARIGTVEENAVSYKPSTWTPDPSYIQ